MDIIERLVERARAHRRTVAFPEARDPRVVQAARRLHDRGIARPVLIGERPEIEAAADEAGVSPDGIESVSPATSGALDGYAALYVEGRPKAGDAGGEAAPREAALLRRDGGAGGGCGRARRGSEPADGPA